MNNELDINKLLKEARFNFSRSGGKGGQNVNKVETKVELVFNIYDSMVITDEVKSLLIKKLYNKIDKESNFRIVSQTERTQLGNRKKVIEKFIKLLENATKAEAIRVKTKKSYSSKLERLAEKKKHSEKKKTRSKKNYLDE